ncbi:UCH-domain-containing protein [Rhizoclosmatium globosum]|uniref:ubiquitinyl hydrolase 1 n=1 Tax=Rhizoclosmatium globosum TaxID=329046 RepID=A0A1Y2CRA7_9FUNG|nr:UCH-domain-containing protein [Rhizoclosmatium globosum]|eukprot:ORY49374.1 UCH-domain-containing protein [Rhizoclosmatium globosum]
MAGSNERYYGLENALYFCKPFRSCVLGYSYPVSSAALAASDAATGLPPLSLPLQTPIQTPIQSSSSTSSAALPFGLLLDSLAQEKSDETLLTTLRDLFAAIASAKKKSGVVKPVNFVSRLKKENELFQGVTQQDAQEFLNFLLNAIAEILIRHKKEMADKLALLGSFRKRIQRGWRPRQTRIQRLWLLRLGSILSLKGSCQTKLNV